MEQIFMLVIMVCVGLALMLVSREEVTSSDEKRAKKAVRKQEATVTGMPELILTNG